MEQNEEINWKRILKSLFILTSILIYFISGTLVLHFVEGKNLIDSFYWIFTLNSQTQSLLNVYKDSTFIPQTTIGKFIIMFYIFLGFPLIGFTFENIADYIFEKEEEYLRSKLDKRRRTKVNLVFWKLMIILVIYIWCFTIGTITYYFGEGWSFVDSLYYAITSSLEGECELFPTKPLTKITATIIVILTDILFVFVLATIAEYIAEYYKESLGNKYLKYKLSKSTLNDMDRNQDGQVSKIEFLQYILIKCEVVDELDIERINERFNQLDYTKDSFLTQKDIRPDDEIIPSQIEESWIEKHLDPLDLL
eukprot:gene1058-10577_t